MIRVKAFHLGRNLAVAVLAYVSFVSFLAAFIVLLYCSSRLRGVDLLHSAAALGVMVGPCVLLAVAAGWAAHRIGRSCARLQQTLGFCSVLHGATVLATWFASNHYEFLLGFELWVLIGLTWMTWPIASLILPGRSLKSFSFPTAISLILLAPCISRLVSLTPSTLGVWRWPSKGRSVIEHSENLGYGFSHVTIAKLNKFELGHHGYLYYRGQQICLFGAPPSISPSGKFAIYQDGPSGNLFLFRRADQKVTQLTPKFVGVAHPFVWHEEQGIVEAQFEKGYPAMTFPLQ
jgi:hypothetical protein